MSDPVALGLLFREAVSLIDARDVAALERLLAEHPRLVWEPGAIESKNRKEEACRVVGRPLLCQGRSWPGGYDKLEVMLRSCSTRRRSASRVQRLLAALALPLQLLWAGPVIAHTDSPGSPPLAPASYPLQHRKPAEIIALFARERLPGSDGAPGPRAARSDTAESLVPAGVDGVLRGEEAHEIVLVGTEGVTALRRCLDVLDAPAVRIGPDHEKIVLTLRRADAGRLRARVLRLPGAGSAAARGRQIALEGSGAWLHRALREVIRAELRLPEAAGSATGRNSAATR